MFKSGCNLKVRRFLSSRASLTPARAGAFKVGRRTNLAACSALARPYLDGSEHTLVRSGRRSEGSPLSGAIHSRHNLVSGRSMDPNHDAVMRIGSEAPKRRTHSISRYESQGADRDSATSNRHRSPVTSIWTRSKLSGCRQYPPFIVPDAKRCRRVQRPAAPAATGRSEVCAPRPQSWACEYRERSRCELDTTAPGRYSSGAEGTATPIGSCLAELERCRNGLALSPGASSRSRLASQ